MDVTERFYIEKIKVEPDDTILVHFNPDCVCPEDVTEICKKLADLHHVPVVSIIPKYGIEKFEVTKEVDYEDICRRVGTSN